MVVVVRRAILLSGGKKLEDRDPGYHTRQSPALEPSTDPKQTALKRTSPINRTRNLWAKFFINIRSFASGDVTRNLLEVWDPDHSCQCLEPECPPAAPGGLLRLLSFTQIRSL